MIKYKTKKDSKFLTEFPKKGKQQNGRGGLNVQRCKRDNELFRSLYFN